MKAFIILLLLVILASGGTVFYYSNQPSESPLESRQQTDEVKTENTQSIKIPPNETSELPSASHGFYEFYSQDGYGYSKASKKVLFFFADWCPTCKESDEDFKSNIDKLPEDVAVFKVHYKDSGAWDEEKALAERYGITYQHTFVQLDEEGHEITKWNGGGLNKLLSSLK